MDTGVMVFPEEGTAHAKALGWEWVRPLEEQWGL